jgi:hypothetical protein
MASGRLRLQLLGFSLDQLGLFLDLLAVFPHPQDFALGLQNIVLELFHPLLVLPLALLVAGIPSPVQHR